MKYKHFFSFLFCSLAYSTLFAQQKTVTLDYFFNNEYRKNIEGAQERFHYVWEDKSINGYSIWGDLFKSKGVIINGLEYAPTKENLKSSDIYIITDPDNWKETLHPNYMTKEYAKIIANWVKQGGVLVMMTNDSANTELHQFNQLSEMFGIHFTDTVRNTVLKDISVGKIIIPEKNEIFKPGRVVYLKGISTISVQSPATPVLVDKSDIIMASAKYGKGTVFAIGDPWIYNEYIVNDRLTSEFQNGIAAEEFTDWLIKQIPKKK